MGLERTLELRRGPLLALAAEPAGALGARRQRPLTERVRARDEIGRRQARELGLRQQVDVALAEPERLCVQRLLEQRAREACVAERLVALGAREDRAEGVVGPLAERVLGLGGEEREDLDEVLVE